MISRVLSISKSEFIKNINSIYEQNSNSLFYKLCVVKRYDLISYLLDYKIEYVDVNYKDNKGRNAFYMLCYNSGSTKILANLLICHRDIIIDSINIYVDGYSWFHNLCVNDCYMSLKYVLNDKTCLEYIKSLDITNTMYEICRKNNIDILKLLLCYNICDINIL